MKAGIALLALAYVLSQFFRAFLAVLTGVLGRDLGVTAEQLSTASGLWFLSFALMQIPIGWSLDKFGPRRTAALLLLLGGTGGAALFALAQSALHINAAMALIGVGCAPVLMASFYIFARTFPPAQFATLAATMIGVGTLGNIVSSYPLAAAVDWIGWRASLWFLAAACGIVALGIFAFVKDPESAESDTKGSLLDLLKMPVLWLIFPLMLVNYAPVAATRGLWIGPYMSDVFGQSDAQIGTATLIMTLAMILGTFFYGPLDRIFGTRKWVVFWGNALTALCIIALGLMPSQSAALSITLFAATGFFGATFPIIIAHARGFFPAHLMGRGVTLMNLFGIGGVSIMQFASGTLYNATANTGTAATPYAMIFVFFGAALLVGTTIYAFTRDAPD